MSETMICIRCGSKTHTTRDHDEGKIGGAAGAAGAKKKKDSSSAQAGAATSSGVKSLYVHHDTCWARPSRNPGIPDVVEPPFRMQPFSDPCIAGWGSRDQCLCRECEKKRKKAAFVESQRQKRIAEKGKFG